MDFWNIPPGTARSLALQFPGVAGCQKGTVIFAMYEVL